MPDKSPAAEPAHSPAAKPLPAPGLPPEPGPVLGLEAVHVSAPDSGLAPERSADTAAAEPLPEAGLALGAGAGSEPASAPDAGLSSPEPEDGAVSGGEAVSVPEAGLAPGGPADARAAEPLSGLAAGPEPGAGSEPASVPVVGLSPEPVPGPEAVSVPASAPEAGLASEASADTPAAEPLPEAGLEAVSSSEAGLASERSVDTAAAEPLPEAGLALGAEAGAGGEAVPVSATVAGLASEASADAPAAEPLSGLAAGPVADNPAAEPVARRPRRKLRALARWTAAVVVFAVFGGATAYAVTQPERTKVPGLKTPDDGRWTFPPLALPKLPAGRPGALDTERNVGGHHYADVRSLLLPLPEDAKEDATLPGVKGWTSPKTFLGLFTIDDRAEAESKLKGDGLRHIVGRAWTMPDGTRTQTYLAQFVSAGYARDYFTSVENIPVAGVESQERDTSVTSLSVPFAIIVHAHKETAPFGATAMRYALVQAGDTLALVMQSSRRSKGKPQGTPAVPFRQTVRLQAQLLG